MAGTTGMLRPPAINLARRPFRNNTLYWTVFGACFTLLSVASGYNVYDFVLKGRELARLRQDLSERTRTYQDLADSVEAMKRDIDKLNLTSLDSKSSFANGLILSRFFCWSLLFDRIEEIIPPEAKIRSIRPSISTTGIEIMIDGLSRTPEILYEFQQNLDESDYFSEVYPISESTRETKGELNFDLVMNYVPAGRTPREPGPPAPPTPTAGLPQPDAAAANASTADAGGAEPQGASGEAPPDAASPLAGAGETIAAPGPPAVASSPVVAQPPAVAAGPPPATAAPVPPPAGPPAVAYDDISQMPDEEFIRRFGMNEYLVARGKWKGKGKRKSPPAVADPNGASP